MQHTLCHCLVKKLNKVFDLYPITSYLARVMRKAFEPIYTRLICRNSGLDPQNPIHEQAKVASHEPNDCGDHLCPRCACDPCKCAEDALNGPHGDLQGEHQGWPGDGSGMDDLADHNANEADDYRNE